MSPTVAAAVDASRELAWYPIANGTASCSWYRARHDAAEELRSRLTRVRRLPPGAQPELVALREAMLRAAAVTYSNRWGRAYADRRQAILQLRGALGAYDALVADRAVADAEGIAERSGLCASDPRGIGRRRPRDGGRAGDVADGVGSRLERHPGHGPGAPRWAFPNRSVGAGRLLGGERLAEHWSAEPDVGRVADGVPARVDRLRALGNAVVPQVVELLGAWILALDEAGEGVA